MTTQPTIHCDCRPCHHWSRYDPEMDDQLPPGWVLVQVADRDDAHFCSFGHASEWLDWNVVANSESTIAGK